MDVPCDAVASNPAISDASTVDAVCAWAARAVAEGGVGISAANVDILRRQEIDGEVLFNLTDAELEKDGMVRGPRKKLLAAVDRFRGPPGGGGLAGAATATAVPSFQVGQSAAGIAEVLSELRALRQDLDYIIPRDIAAKAPKVFFFSKK